MEVDASNATAEKDKNNAGIQQYYTSKIEELQVINSSTSVNSVG